MRYPSQRQADVGDKFATARQNFLHEFRSLHRSVGLPEEIGKIQFLDYPGADVAPKLTDPRGVYKVDSRQIAKNHFQAVLAH